MLTCAVIPDRTHLVSPESLELEMANPLSYCVGAIVIIIKVRYITGIGARGAKMIRVETRMLFRAFSQTPNTK